MSQQMTPLSVASHHRKSSGAARATAVLIAGAAFVAGATLAHADDDCNLYAQMAAKQLQQNQAKNCGLKGEAWNPATNKAAMVAWCQKVTPDEWRKAISDRQKQLQGCGS